MDAQIPPEERAILEATPSVADFFQKFLLSVL